MGRIKETYKKLVELDMEELCLDATLAVEETATNMNTDQLWQGERADGTNLPDYSRASVVVFGKHLLVELIFKFVISIPSNGSLKICLVFPSGPVIP